ncbi:hypothetical protein OED01_01920 [Microbacterium sp. M28]|uniref:hypothetical protein n=1 Tax=Microbacterium sp. M28 TaxID=2962064 RepID=UPI0021F45329|nr:hypothetical protein [Microbacterium sp. M28]UYO97514.1 hypothetical protein OED01_01920 [Microbacterium sp. M28]
MTDANATLRDLIVDHDDNLRDLLQVLLRHATRRQMWLMFIDDHGRLGDPIMPMDDVPADPHEEVVVDDLGLVDQAHVLMHRSGLLLELTGNASVVLVWERIGSSVLDDDDRAWASAMADEAASLQVPLRAQFLLHNRGIRQLHPDDYL